MSVFFQLSLALNIVGVIAVVALIYAYRTRRENRALARIAYFDPLTGLANRTRFKDNLQTVLDRRFNGHSKIRRQTDYVSSAICFVFDLDGFKAVNDILGHHAGDAILAQFASILSEYRRLAIDTAGRWGGDEFTLTLVNVTPARAVEIGQEICERVSMISVADLDMTIDRASLAEKGISVSQIKIGVTIGVSEVRSGDTVDVLISRADKSLVAGKPVKKGVVYTNFEE